MNSAMQIQGYFAGARPWHRRRRRAAPAGAGRRGAGTPCGSARRARRSVDRARAHASQERSGRRRRARRDARDRADRDERRSSGVILPRGFYARPTLEVARRSDRQGARARDARAARAAGVIVEVEAYIGESDPACHAAPGPTARNAPLYGPPGVAYVYLNYGIHYLVNAVTEPKGSPAAILIRALEPVDGEALMRRRRARYAGRGRRRSPAPICAAGPAISRARSASRCAQNTAGPDDGAAPDRGSGAAAAAARLEPPHRDHGWSRGRMARLCRPTAPRCRDLSAGAARRRRSTERRAAWPRAFCRSAAAPASPCRRSGESASMRMKCVASSTVVLLKLTMMSYAPDAGGVRLGILRDVRHDHALGVRRVELLGEPGVHRIELDAGDRAAAHHAVGRSAPP